MISFKTYDEQIEILQSRGLIIEDADSAKLFLEKNNYYNVINAYKDIFVEKGVTPEKFKNNTTFGHIQSLWSFDKLLRMELFRVITAIERIVKSKIAYEFSKAYGVKDYLNIGNFNETKYTAQIIKLIHRINDEESRLKFKGDSMLLHYSKNHGCIPLWVLVNIFSMGDIGKFYEYMKEKDQKAIAKSLSEMLCKRLEPKEIINYIKILVQARNLCAHDQRIFTFKSSNSASSKNAVNVFLNIDKPINNFFAIIPAVYTFSTTDTFKRFIRDLNNCFYCLRFFNINTMLEINNIMGLPLNWLSLIHIS